MKFPIKDFFFPRKTGDLFTCTDEIFNRKFQFFYSLFHSLLPSTKSCVVINLDKHILFSEACLGLSQTSMMELFTKVAIGFIPLTIFAKRLYRRCMVGS